MPQVAAYQIVKLANGMCSLRSLAQGETFHPVIGPVAEAEALYVRQLRLPERIGETDGEFVLWDVGLGAAANALTALHAVRDHLAGPSAAARESRAPKRLRLVSFDLNSDALAFALQHSAELDYLAGHETVLVELAQNHRVRFGDSKLQVEWSLELGDFPKLISSNRDNAPVESEHQSPIRSDSAVCRNAGSETGVPACLPAPHAILFDPHSPGKNPEMWTLPLFTGLFRRLDPQRPCDLATYTRSTLARVAMLLGGFFVGAGYPSGLKEETTVAANRLERLDAPLNHRWLERAKRSDGAEPLHEPVYRQRPLSPETWEKLRQHPQFR
jgi:tRNA U34 5-methylaminomethyl-2-thiouridine-forming methyltransferase MnmC